MGLLVEYNAVLQRQPLSAHTHRAYRVRVYQYADYLRPRVPDYGNPLQDPEVFYRGRLKCPIKIGLGPSRFLGISADCLREQRLASLFQPIFDRLTPELCRGTMEMFGNLSEFVVDFLR
jgi:hypothetical protein